MSCHSQPIRSGALRHVTATVLLFCIALGAGAAAQAESIRLGTPPWPGATVKTEVASQLLEGIGYEAEVVNASTAAIIKSIEQKKVHANLALWRPSQNGILDPAIERGGAIELTANIEGARYQNAVPEYVWDAGVRSLADLREHADRFDRTFYGIESGNVGNELVKKAIKNDTYGLSGWEVVPSSTSGMLAQVDRAVVKKEWIVFLGWQPHWMNIKFDMKYLADPEGIWGKKTTIYTVVHPDFVDEQPNVARFLKQMVVAKEVQSQWILEYGYNDRSAEEVAAEWIAANRDTVDEWLAGVTGANGDRAASEVLTERLAAANR